MMPDKDWLGSLKVGDVVAVRSTDGFRSSSISTYRITRLTATQIVVEGNHGAMRYRRDDGSRIGGRGRFTFPKPIEPVTQDILNSIEGQKLRDWLNLINAQSAALDLTQLRELKAAYEGYRNEIN